jgi:outer membrane protein assembly factor BamB
MIDDSPFAMIRGTALAAILLALAAPLAAEPPAAAEWRQWRGPDRNGRSPETGLLQEWPEGGPKLLWTAKGIGDGYTAITKSEGRIFTMGDLEGASHVVALDADGGKIAWKAKVGKAGAPGWGGFAGPRASVTLDGELAYAVDQWGQLVCVETAGGMERWRVSYTADLGASRPEWGFTESPLVDGDRLVVTPGGRQGAVVALDKKTGKVIWRTKDFSDGAQYCSVLPAEIAGARQYIQMTMESLVGISPDGKVLWKTARKGETAVIPDPVVSGDLVYTTSGYGVGCSVFRVTAEGSSFSVEKLWSNKDISNHHGGVVLVGDHIYGHSDSKGWVCQEAKTGKTVWREKEKLGKGSITYADGRLVLRAEDGPGTIVLIEASTEGWKEHGRFDQLERSARNSWPHPVIAGGRLYIRDQDVLLCYDVKGK